MILITCENGQRNLKLAACSNAPLPNQNRTLRYERLVRGWQEDGERCNRVVGGLRALKELLNTIEL